MSSILKNSDVSGDVQNFKLPVLETGGRLSQSKYKMPSAKEIEDIYKNAYHEGYASGKEQAFKDVQEHVRAKLTDMNNVLSSIYRPVEDIENELVEILTRITINIAGNILRRETRQNTGQIAAVVSESLKLLPISTEQLTLVLSPEDATFIKETYQNVEHPYSWKIREDPSITQGGCVIVTESSTIDARVETQLNDLCYQMLGGTRKADLNDNE